jgi:hypothetical protein
VPARRLENSGSNGTQRQPLPIGHGLRDLGMKSQITVKINGVRGAALAYFCSSTLRNPAWLRLGLAWPALAYISHGPLNRSS